MGNMLLRETYHDRVRGAWLGMSVGVTLGGGANGSLTPVVKDFYDPLPGQPSASAEIDMQLLLVHALRTRSGDASADDLADEWLDHVRYLTDAYGYADYNLRRGLRAPLSGDFGNWFRESITAAGRSPFWGMVAPGDPQAAASLAWADASIDHSGEGVWAAMFWAGAVSAAFLAPDDTSVLAAALAMAPDTSRVHRAARAAMSAFVDGAPYLVARDRIIETSGAADFADAAVNTGFAAYAWLRAKGDLGAAVTAAAGCGYAACVSAGLAGTLCGARLGAAKLPPRWIEPIGAGIVPGWGLLDLDVEHTVDEVTAHIAALGEKVSARCCAGVELVDVLPAAPRRPQPAEEPAPTQAVTSAPVEAAAQPATVPAEEPAPTQVVTPAPVEASAQPATVPAEEPAPTQVVTPAPVDWRDNARVTPLHERSATTVILEAGAFVIDVDYGTDGPALTPGSTCTALLAVRNTGPHPFTGTVTLSVPTDWRVAVPESQGRRQTIVAGGMARFGFVISVPEEADLRARNEIAAVLTPEKGRAVTCPIPYLGGTCWWIVGPLPNVGEEGFHRVYEVEDRPGLDRSYLGRGGGLAKWEKAACATPVMPIEERFTGMPGVTYLATTLHVPTPVQARIVVHTSDGVRLWLNGGLVAQRHSHDAFRPVLGQSACQADVTLVAGENKILVKAVRDMAPYGFCFCVADRNGRPILDIGSTRW